MFWLRNKAPISGWIRLTSFVLLDSLENIENTKIEINKIIERKIVNTCIFLSVYCNMCLGLIETVLLSTINNCFG